MAQWNPESSLINKISEMDKKQLKDSIVDALIRCVN